MAGDVVIERLFEFMREDGVVLIEHRQHLRQEAAYHLNQNGVVGLQNASNTRVEVVVVEIVRNLLAVVQNDLEVAGNQVQTFHHRIGLVETGLWEDQHHKGIQQFLILYELHIARGHLLGKVQNSTVVHFAQEDREEVGVPGEVLPHDPTVVAEEDLGLVPQLRK